MQQPNPILQELARLEDKIFFDRTQELPEALEDHLLWAPRHQLSIAAPRQVELSTHQSLPILLLASNSDARRSVVKPGTHMALLAVDLETGKLSSCLAFPDDPTKTLPATEAVLVERALPPDFPEGMDSAETSPLERSLPATISTVWLDAIDLGTVAPEPGRSALRVIELERLSNPVVTTLVQEGQPVIAHPGPPVEQARQAELEARRLHSAEDSLKSFRRTPATPELQDEGCAIQTLTTLTAGSRSLPFHGVARLELGSGMLVRGEHPGISSNELPQALIPVYILITEVEGNSPRVFEIPVPYSAESEPEAGLVVEVCVSLDLAERLVEPLSPGTYFLFFVAGPHASGPWRLDVAPA